MAGSEPSFIWKASVTFAAHTEIELASRIQQQLVPPIQATVGSFEAYGVSLPSGTVGGDLIDLIQADGLLCAYVADVAGHGVAAGVMMSMVKTAVRMHFMARSRPPAPDCSKPSTTPSRPLTEVFGICHLRLSPHLTGEGG